MNIIKASIDELIEVMYLLRVCVHDLNRKGWYCGDLQNQQVKSDIVNNSIFIYRKNEAVIGLMKLTDDEIVAHKSVAWSSTSGKPLIMRQLLVHPNWKNNEIERSMLTFAEKYAREQGFTSLRLEVYSENQDVVFLYGQMDYKQLGEVKLHYQDVPYICFEKVL